MADRLVQRRDAFQFGVQSAIGTAATTFPRALPANSFDFSPQRQLDIGEDVRGRGSDAASEFAPDLAGEAIQIVQTQPLDAISSLVPFHTGFGFLTGENTALGGTNGRQWVLERDAQTGRAIVPGTLRYVQYNNDAPLVAVQHQITDLYPTQIVISSTPNGRIGIATTYMGNGPTVIAGAPLSTPTLDTPRFMPTALAEVFIDDTFAAMSGNTPTKVGNITAFTITINTGLVYNLDEIDGSLGFTDVDRSGVVSTDVNLTLTVPASASGIVAEETAHRDAQDARFVLVRMRNPALIDTGQPEFYEVAIGAACYHQAASLTQRGQAQADGKHTMNIVLRSTRDGTTNDDLYVRFLNDVEFAELP